MFDNQRKIRKELRIILRRYSKLPKRCYFCLSKDKIEVHHILPSHSGGNNEVCNLSWLCDKCHVGIHDRDPNTKRDYVGQFMKRLNPKLKRKFIKERGNPLKIREELKALRQQNKENGYKSEEL